MKTKNNITLILTTIITLLPVLPGVALYGSLPEQIPTHFNYTGEVDGYMPKNIVVFVLPVALALLNAFVNFAIKTDPKRNNTNEIMVAIGKWIIPFASCIFMPISLLYGIGYEIPVNIIVQGMVGILFILLGNYMPKIRQNYTVGIKLPWTLNDENNWHKTHRMAGVLYVVSGIALIASAFAPAALKYTIIVIIILCVSVPFIYSYLLYKKGN